MRQSIGLLATNEFFKIVAYTPLRAVLGSIERDYKTAYLHSFNTMTFMNLLPMFSVIGRYST